MWYLAGILYLLNLKTNDNQQNKYDNVREIESWVQIRFLSTWTGIWTPLILGP